MVIIYEAFYDSKGKVGYLYTLMSAPKTDDLAYKASNAKKAKVMWFISWHINLIEPDICQGSLFVHCSRSMDGYYWDLFESGNVTWLYDSKCRTRDQTSWKYGDCIP